MATLISKRLADLESANRNIQQQYQELLAVGERNEQRFQWLKKLILALLEISNLKCLDQVLQDQLSQLDDVDHVKLYIFDSPQEASFHTLKFAGSDRVDDRLAKLTTTRCETCRASQYTEMFEVAITHSASAALIPLHFKEYRATLAIGSLKPDKFTSQVDTLFLDFLGEVIIRVVTRVIE